MTREEYIKQWHAELCAEARRIEKAKEETPCVNCNYPLKDHYRGKCNAYVTSPDYLAVNRKEVERVGATIETLESLAKAQGWTL